MTGLLPLRNSQQGWLSTQDSEKIKSVNISAWWGGSHKAPPLAKELLATDGCWERESQFSQGCDLVDYPCSLAGVPTPMCIQTAQTGLCELFKKKRKRLWSWEGAGRSCGGAGSNEGWIWASYIEYLWDSINYNKHIHRKRRLSAVLSRDFSSSSKHHSSCVTV